jgi:hypothetical protein
MAVRMNMVNLRRFCYQYKKSNKLTFLPLKDEKSVLTFFNHRIYIFYIWYHGWDVQELIVPKLARIRKSYVNHLFSWWNLWTIYFALRDQDLTFLFISLPKRQWWQTFAPSWVILMEIVINFASFAIMVKLTVQSSEIFGLMTTILTSPKFNLFQDSLR